MTDYGIPEDAIDAQAMDRAWTEEAVRRAHDLADHLYEALHDDPAPSCYQAEHQVLVKVGELSSLLYELGIHLDYTAGYNITSGGEP